jgi:hypothetical protein
MEVSSTSSYNALGPPGLIRISGDGLELGIALGKAAIKSKRLTPSSKSPKRITHSVLISELSDIDEELMFWIKAAWQQARNGKRRSA